MTDAVAVTGMGVVAPGGWGTEAYWQSLLQGRCSISTPTLFDSHSLGVHLAGEVTEDLRDHLPGRVRKQTDRMTQLALLASDWALRDAAVEINDPLSAGVFTASASGGFHFGQKELQNLWSEGPSHVSAYMSFAWFYAVNTGQISIRHDLRGPTGVLVAEQAGGLDAIAAAARHIEQGTDVMLTGGMDSALCPYGIAAQIRSGRLSTSTDPATAYTPHHPQASGHVPAEGGCILVLEPLSNAQRRGAQPYGLVTGSASTFDPHPRTGRPDTLAEAIRLALVRAQIAPSDVAAVFADGAGTPGLDQREADALHAVFDAMPPITVPKACYGRAYSGAGGLDTAAALLALRDGVLPPTPNPAAATSTLSLVQEQKPFTIGPILVLARGEGGFNSALVVERAA